MAYNEWVCSCCGKFHDPDKRVVETHEGVCRVVTIKGSCIDCANQAFHYEIQYCGVGIPVDYVKIYGGCTRWEERPEGWQPYYCL